ncbi:MAG: hypothetical protein ACON49_09750 [Candidatus Puniceispirillaceae bacterium]
MALWVILAIAAATAQTIRSAGQKQLIASLGKFGASYARFIYALPFAALWLIIYGNWASSQLPSVNSAFLFWVSIGAVTQIIFTILLMTLFAHRNFAASTAFSKTEVLQAAFLEALIIGVVVSAQTLFAILLGVLAIMLLTIYQSRLSYQAFLTLIASRQSVIGLASGAALGLATVTFRAATDSLDGDDIILKASLTGFIATLWQTIFMGAALFILARKELIATLISWRSGWIVGLSGAVATACWFIAFSAHAVAPVRAVGQIELLITIGVSVFYFKERLARTEWIAITLLGLSILLVLLS